MQSSVRFVSAKSCCSALAAPRRAARTRPAYKCRPSINCLRAKRPAAAPRSTAAERAPLLTAADAPPQVLSHLHPQVGGVRESVPLLQNALRAHSGQGAAARRHGPGAGCAPARRRAGELRCGGPHAGARSPKPPATARLLPLVCRCSPVRRLPGRCGPPVGCPPDGRPPVSPPPLTLIAPVRAGVAAAAGPGVPGAPRL